MKKLVVFLLSVGFSTACSTTSTQLDSTERQVDEANHIVKVSQNPAMAAVGSATPVMTVKQQLRADPGWNSVANEILNCVQDLAGSVLELKQAAIFVANLAEPSEQSKAFRSIVMTKLVQNGFAVTFEPAEAFHLKYDVVTINNELKEKLGVKSDMDVIVRVALVKGEQVITNQSEYKTAKREDSQLIMQYARNL